VTERAKSVFFLSEDDRIVTKMPADVCRRCGESPWSIQRTWTTRSYEDDALRR
jgi:YgiT-type zinc finger domain-containing protein